MKASAGEVIPVGALRIRFLVESPDSGGSVSMFELTVPDGARVPAPHSHDAFEETIYGLEGTLTWTVEGGSIEIGAGESVCIGRGQVHGFENRSGAPARCLCIATPGAFGPEFFREMGAVMGGAGGGPPDPEQIGAVMCRHGLTPAQ